MTLWLDAQFPPRLTRWLITTFHVQAHALRDVGLQGASDSRIFDAAFEAGAVLVTKDHDFLELRRQKSRAPRIVFLRDGNIPNSRLKSIWLKIWPSIRGRLEMGEDLIVLDVGA